MMYAASLCISPQPDQRPRMSKVSFSFVKILTSTSIAVFISCVNFSLRLPRNSYELILRTMQVLKILEGDFITDMACDYRGRPSLCLPQNTNSSQATDQRTMQTTLPSNTLKPVNPTNRNEMLSTAWGLNQLEPNVSQEYQAYLHSSLAKFVRSLNEN